MQPWGCITRSNHDWEAPQALRSQAKEKVESILIHNDLRIVVCVGIEPGSVVLWHIDAAMTAVSGVCFVAAHIVVGELRARSEVLAPPGIMDEVAIRVIVDGVVDRRWRIPVR